MISKLKSGRLSKEEQKQILEQCVVFTPQEIAEKLGRRLEPIIEFLVKNGPKIEKPSGGDEELIRVLHTKVYWRGINEQFSKKEVQDFEIYWTGFINQFNNDIEFSEEMQIVDLIKLKLLAERNLYERNKARAAIEELQNIHDEFKQQHGPPPYADGSLAIQEATLASQVKSCESAYIGRTTEYKTLLDKQQAYYDELKATRKQRIEFLKNTKKDWISLMRALTDEKRREKEGRELALMNLAAEKEKGRLSEIHIYADGQGDKPLLTAETVEEDNG